MRRFLVGTAAALALVLTGGCGPFGGRAAIEASGSTRYFFHQLDQADALADYVTLPRSLADTLPNRTYVQTRPGPFQFSWTKQVVLGRVTSVAVAADHRVRLRIRVEESFPATTATSVDVLVASTAPDEHRYLASAASLSRVVLGIDRYRGDDGKIQTVVAMSSQLIGVVDDQDRISYPVLGRQDFTSAAWDRGMTTVAGLRREARAAASTIAFGRG